jgi:hypothetical protein
MNNNEQHPKKPSREQIDLLRRLADEREVSFGWPSTSGEASAEIKALLRRPKARRADRQLETQAVRAAMANRGDAASIRPKEIAGYGSSATFRTAR